MLRDRSLLDFIRQYIISGEYSIPSMLGVTIKIVLCFDFWQLTMRYVVESKQHAPYSDCTAPNKKTCWSLI